MPSIPRPDVTFGPHIQYISDRATVVHVALLEVRARKHEQKHYIQDYAVISPVYYSSLRKTVRCQTTESVYNIDSYWEYLARILPIQFWNVKEINAGFSRSRTLSQSPGFKQFHLTKKKYYSIKHTYWHWFHSNPYSSKVPQAIVQ